MYLQKTWFGPEKEWGVCATIEYHAGDFICEYIGQRVEDPKKIEALKDDTSGSFYRFFYNRCNRTVLCIDAKNDTHHLGRLINHSRLKPNAKMVSTELNGKIHLVVVARTTIEVKDEILYDYGERRKDVVAQYPWLKL